VHLSAVLLLPRLISCSIMGAAWRRKAARAVASYAGGAPLAAMSTMSAWRRLSQAGSRSSCAPVDAVDDDDDDAGGCQLWDGE
jgi:hypothetical protein